MPKKQTWQYQENGCPTCNATGTVKRNCPRWNDPKHTARNCSCWGGLILDRCPTCNGTCRTR
ncbi:hypothetical protein [Micromonospora sp. KC721]|uniref:hypothetical protein n=1 Tax=Micromonospora sp. KC721 TaxID=2530380 RepID=UPI0010494B76|nr:hypothetical protein [Micromonospora sp. KC721]TDB78414.1 hypothetical protein E1182_15805 [Micromonospora sp. KC721]